jgi:hypothetical protein
VILFHQWRRGLFAALPSDVRVPSQLLYLPCKIRGREAIRNGQRETYADAERRGMASRAAPTVAGAVGTKCSRMDFAT